MDILVIGSGPAGLLAADILSAAGRRVRLFERRPGPGWKLLVAGSSGLNVSFAGEPVYTARAAEVAACLGRFPREEWLAHLHGLGEETFLGTSRRYFLRNPKAAGLLQAWRARLEAQGVDFHFGEELVDFFPGGARFASGLSAEGTVLLALGGPSWETEPPAWPEIFRRKGLGITAFAPANAGYEIEAPAGFFAKAEGKPVKGLVLRTSRGERAGECMITRYGLEGTPVYTVGCPGEARVDLKPDLPLTRLEERLRAAGPKRFRAAAKLSEGAWLLLEAMAPAAASSGDAARLAAALKNLPLRFLRPRPLSESISASGGLSWDELDEGLQLRRVPGVYCVGEMVDWDAPTGGYLIQASVSMAAVAARAILSR